MSDGDEAIALAHGGQDPVALPGDGERRRLPARAVAYWRTLELVTAVPFAVAVTLVAALVPGIPSAVRAVAIVLVWLLAIGRVGMVPPVRRRIWWYAVGEDQIDLHHGLVTVTRTVVPMVRVQHVDLHTGPIADRYRLARIEVHTAAGSVEIPALDREEGEHLRRRIAELARVPDDL